MQDDKINPAMEKHRCKAIVVTCIDFRFQQYIEAWEKENLSEYSFDKVALAGAIFDFFTVIKQIDASHKLHGVKKVVLINHEDCGAYGQLGTYQRHKHDLLEAKKKIGAVFPTIEVTTLYLHINGEFEVIT